MSDINTYIQESRKRGLNDVQIKQELLKAGWNDGQVDQNLLNHTNSWGRLKKWFFYLLIFAIVAKIYNVLLYHTIANDDFAMGVNLFWSLLFGIFVVSLIKSKIKSVRIIFATLILMLVLYNFIPRLLNIYSPVGRFVSVSTINIPVTDPNFPWNSVPRILFEDKEHGITVFCNYCGNTWTGFHGGPTGLKLGDRIGWVTEGLVPSIYSKDDPQISLNPQFEFKFDDYVFSEEFDKAIEGENAGLGRAPLVSPNAPREYVIRKLNYNRKFGWALQTPMKVFAGGLYEEPFGSTFSLLLKNDVVRKDREILTLMISIIEEKEKNNQVRLEKSCEFLKTEGCKYDSEVVPKEAEIMKSIKDEANFLLNNLN